MRECTKTQNHISLASNRAKTFENSPHQYKQQVSELFAQKKYKKLESLLVKLSYDETYDTLVTREKVLLRLVRSDYQVENISNFDFFNKENPQESLEKIVLLLVDRLHLKEALKLLQNYITGHTDNRVALRLYHKYKSNLKNDYYYRYYGYFIMILQAFTTGLVLSVSLWFVEQAFHSVSGFIYYILTLWALIPVFYINVIMIKDRMNQSEDCYTEVHPEGLLISHHSHLYFLSKSDKVFLYQDDNDYSFISLIRHLPFVPNFTYIRALDKFSNEMVTLPLYGVSDGQLFKEVFESKEKIRDLNMIGVRVGQLQNFFGDWNKYFKVSGGIVSCISFLFFTLSLIAPKLMTSLYESIILSSKSNFFTYIESQSTFIFYSQYYSYQFQEQIFFLSIVGIGTMLFFVRDFSKNLINNLFEIPLIDSVLQFPIVRGGIVIISALFLYNHYAEYHKGFIPVILGTAWFYLVFVKTKYEKEVKELVAVLSAHREAVINNDQDICREHDINHFSFPCESRFTFQMKYLFFNKTHIVRSNRCFGYVFKYDVQKLDDATPIKIYDLNGRTRIEIGEWKFVSSFSAEGLKTQFQSKGFQVEILDLEKNWKDTFENIFRADKIQVICVASLFACLGVTGGIGVPIAVFSVILFAVIASKIIVKLEWILIICFFIYQADLMNYKQSQNVKEVHMSSFKSFREKFANIDLDLSKTRTHYDQNKMQFTITENKITYQDYENYLRLHPEKEFKHVPPFIHASSPREEAIDILYWHISQKRERFSGYRYGSALNEYCVARGLGFNLRTDSCGVMIDVKRKSESTILWDVITDGPLSVIKTIPSPFIEKALIQDPELFYLIPRYIKKNKKLLSIVKIHHLKELKNNPALILDCHPILLGDRSFIEDFVLMLFNQDLGSTPKGRMAMIALSKSSYFHPLATERLLKIVSENKELYSRLSRYDFYKNLPAPIDYKLKQRTLTPYLSKTKMGGRFKSLQSGKGTGLSGLKFDRLGAALILELALNKIVSRGQIPTNWAYASFVSRIFKNKEIDIDHLLEYQDSKNANGDYGAHLLFGLHPTQLMQLIHHPKIKMSTHKTFIQPARRKTFQRMSPWASNAFDQELEQFSKKIRLAQLAKKHQSSSPSFARRLKTLSNEKVSIKDTDILFHYSMLKDDWKHILKSDFLKTNDNALEVVRESLLKDIARRKVLLIDLPKFLQKLMPTPSYGISR